MGKIVVGCWDCDYCKADRISGEIAVCPNCGKPRGKDVKFYMAGPKIYVDDPNKVSRKPDWLCSFCDTLNADENKFCTSCGASREDSEMNYFEVKKKQEEEARKKAEEEERKRREQGLSNKGTQSSGKSGGVRMPLLLIAVLAFAAIIFITSMPRKKGMHVDSKIWERIISIESQQAVQDSGWSLPDGAWDVTSREEIYGYNSVLDHYETRERQVAEEVLDGYDISYEYRDLGNGHFEEVEVETPRYRTEYHTEYYEEPVYISVPVYETKYYYTINRWVFDREEKTSGADDEPYFAELTLLDTEREAGRKESYHIISGDKTYEVSYDIWQQIVTGSDINAKVQSGKIVSIQ